ncbi:hypothetical protein HHI36_011232 [Cryptolaemus montrouzieri]|uniref:Cuticle protein 6 n=1 Tax=Cryptolaemus montrouzieri TaxID=559131 RepID=A0ABD2ML68_9CUCU
MTRLWLFLISVGVASCKTYYVDPILRQENIQSTDGIYKFGFDSKTQNVEQFRGSDGIIRGSFSYLDNDGRVQHMEYIAGPDGYHVYNANLPVTVASVTETPEVQAARKAHEEAYNYLSSVSSAQVQPAPITTRRVLNKKGNIIRDRTPTYLTTTETPYVRENLISTPTPLLKNRYNTLEIVRKKVESQVSPDHHPTENIYQHMIVNTPSSIIKNHRFSIQSPLNSEASSERIPDPASHLEALRRVITSQLATYNENPSNLPQTRVPEVTPKYESFYKTELAAPVKVEHYFPNSIKAESAPKMNQDKI